MTKHLCDEECGDQTHPQDGRIVSYAESAEREAQTKMREREIFRDASSPYSGTYSEE